MSNESTEERALTSVELNRVLAAQIRTLTERLGELRAELRTLQGENERLTEECDLHALMARKITDQHNALRTALDDTRGENEQTKALLRVWKGTADRLAIEVEELREENADHVEAHTKGCIPTENALRTALDDARGLPSKWREWAASPGVVFRTAEDRLRLCANELEAILQSSPMNEEP